MKIVMQTMLLCALISATIALPAEGDTQYPFIAQYAPAPIKDLCVAPHRSSKAACKQIEKLMWCTYQAKNLQNQNKEPSQEFKSYCAQCITQHDINIHFVSNIINYIADDKDLTHDQAVELFMQLNAALHSIQKDAKDNDLHEK